VTTKVVILGAGFGGLELATRLSTSVADEASITLIDQSDGFVFGFSKFDVMFGERSVSDVRSLYRDIDKASVEFRQETVVSIDPIERRVVTERATYGADVLVVALGADLHPELTPGFEDGGNEFYSVAGAERLRDVLRSFGGGVVIVGVLGTPFKCPPAPSEAAILLHDHFAARNVGVEIRVVSPFGSPIPVSAASSEAVLAAFEERGIEWLPQQIVKTIDPGQSVARLADGQELPYDLFLGIPKHRVPVAVEAAGLAPDGWITIDPATLATPFPDVYAVGDVTNAPVPKAGVFAETAAQTLAKVLIHRIRGGAPPPPYDGAGTCYIEFGDHMVGRVDASFLTGGTPSGPFTPPSLEVAAEKQEFASTRRARWFGTSLPA
jgi:sulfide:quinone oxidoreductase